jgi:hypothetical protein
MKYPRYEYSTEDQLFLFEFESVGVKGKIKKVVQYSRMSIDGFFNLAFGDFNLETKEIDDQIISNNGDGLKVLATVVSTLYAFTGKYPESNVFATGSNDARTRLYRMGITNNLEELKKDFLVFGLRKDEIFENFIVGEDYLGFLVTRKKHKL